MSVLLKGYSRINHCFNSKKSLHRFSSTCFNLISCQFLREKMNQPRFFDQYQILDATWDFPSRGRNTQQEHINARIPGSKYFDIEKCRDQNTDLPRMLPGIKEFEKFVSGLGISNGHHVIVYDNQSKSGLFSAPRVWWMFRVFGHDMVSVLDGGFPKWKDNEYPIESGEEKSDDEVYPTHFKASFRSWLVKDLDFMKNNLKSEKRIQVVDARSNVRFRGVSQDPSSAIPDGHIPHSLNVPFTECLTPDTKIMKTADELRNVFSENGVDLKKEMISSCGSGVTAAIVALAAKICSGQDVPVYDGSWSEWARKVPDQIQKDN